MTQSLADQFDALHAERERSWDPDKLRRNVEQRRALVAAFDPAATVRAGDRIAPFTLELADGTVVDSTTLTARGPVALIFFRFAGCPACNIALPHYDRTLRPALAALGVGLVGVSPHLPETGLGDIATHHRLGFPVAADRGNALGRRLGITFVPDDAPPVAADDAGWIGALTGTGSWELPQPAIVVIDRDHVVRFADVSPDWLRRTETERVVEALEGLRLASAA
ncbi:peroxiredoxin-like family protein [Sphingomonas bacterium]|uniref:peroxiredoxin-like family protein n=1 Tax=Sphingomonas bacterium TaxID=1895847 RepID=UPI0015757DC7|nr:peroxiredoxin-like family protein [Sphingomonas bacterium]